MFKKFTWQRWTVVAVVILSLFGCGLFMGLTPSSAVGKMLPGFANPRWLSTVSSIVFKTLMGSDVYDLRKEKLLPLTSLTHIEESQSPGFSWNNVLNPICYVTGQPSDFMGFKADKVLVQRLKKQPEIASAKIIWKFMDQQIIAGKLPPQARQVANIGSDNSMKGVANGIHVLLQNRIFREMPIENKIAFLNEIIKVIQTVREGYTALWEVNNPDSIPSEFDDLRVVWQEEQQNYSDEQITVATREAGFALWEEVSTLQADLEDNLDKLCIQEAQMYITGVDYQRFPSVTTYVSLVDALNRPLDSPMGNAAFQIWDGDRRALIVETMRMDNPNINSNSHVVMVIDASGSMSGAPIEQAKKAANAYVNMSRAGETFSILKFSGNTEVLLESSRNKEALNAAIDRIETGSNTALYDALVRSFDLLSNVEGRKAVLVLSDGANNSGSHTLEDVMSMAKKAGISVYSIAVGESSEHQILAELSEQTGGKCYFTAETNALQDIYMEINKMFRNQYKINYIVADRENKMRPLKIKLTVGGKTITSETTYMPELEAEGRWND